jgi:REP element-mobilizing transposase RayT
MPSYRRAFIPGGSWFFTVNLLHRHHNDLLIREIDLLHEVVRRVRERHPFQIDAWVVLPEHLHSTAWMQEVGQRRSSCRACGPCRPAIAISACDGA